LINKRVIAHSLEGKVQLNGLHGQCIGYEEATQRYTVLFLGGHETSYALKPLNLKLVTLEHAALEEQTGGESDPAAASNAAGRVGRVPAVAEAGSSEPH